MSAAKNGRGRGPDAQPDEKRQAEQQMRDRIVQRERQRSDDSGEEGAWRGRPHEEQRKQEIAQQVRRHRVIGDRGDNERGRADRDHHGPARRFRRACNQPCEPVHRGDRERPDHRIRRPWDAEPDEWRQQQGETGPVAARHLARRPGDPEKVAVGKRRDQPIDEVRGKDAGQVAGSKGLRLEYGRVLVHRQRIVVVDAQRAEAKQRENRRGHAPGPLGGEAYRGQCRRAAGAEGMRRPRAGGGEGCRSCRTQSGDTRKSG